MSRWRRPRDDGGYALISAIGLMMLATALMLTLLALSLREAQGTGRDRARSAAVSTAEAAVDATMANITNVDPASLPCGTSTSTTTVGVDTLTVTTTVTYYTAAGAAVGCPAPAGTVLAQAGVKGSVVTAGGPGQPPATRAVEAMVRLTPTFAQGLDKAIFGNAGISLANNGEIFGTDGQANADVYTNGNFDCNNNQRYHGSVYAQGYISLANTCVIDVDAWAKTDFRAANTGVKVSGDVKVSSGNAYLVRNATVSGKVYARSTSGEYCAANPGKCVVTSSLPAPPAQAFPVLRWDAATQAQWASASAAQGGPYTIINLDGDATYGSCNLTDSANGPGKWLQDKAATLSSPTVIVTSCGVVLQNNNTIKVGANLAVVAKGGVRFSNSTKISSTTAASRYLYLIQPADGISIPCTSEGITLDNQVTLDATISEFIYTPCNVRKANNSTHYGQIYAGGQAQIDNKLTMYYRPLPVWGVSSSSSTVKSYGVDILYKRETIS